MSEIIIIIGAGIAGLAAVRTLHDAGYSSVIFEARERIGGRLNTSYHWPDMPIDLGGSWIHKVDGNPITTLARKVNASHIATNYDKCWVFDGHGNRISESWASIDAFCRPLIDELLVLGQSDPHQPEATVAAILERIVDT